MTKTAITAIMIAIASATAASAQSRETPLYDKDGRYNGSVFDYGKTQTYTDRNGHFNGSAVNNSNGTTSFFNRNGSFSGSAGSSIDRAFNFNRGRTMNHDATYGMIAIAIMICGYLLPWIVAAIRGHLNTMAIGVLNLFLGWTFLGWIAALVWACTSNVKPRPQRQPRRASLYGLASLSQDNWERLKAHPKNLTQVGLGE